MHGHLNVKSVNAVYTI